MSYELAMHWCGRCGKCAQLRMVFWLDVCMSSLLAMYLRTFYAQQNSYFVCNWSGGGGVGEGSWAYTGGHSVQIFILFNE